MTVVELFPGAGWKIHKILGTVLAEKGKLYVAIGGERLRPQFKTWGLEKIEVAPAKVNLKPSGQFGVFQSDVVDPGVKNADMVLTFSATTTT